MGREEKRARADAKEAADAKWKDAAEAVKGFNEARAQEKEASNPPDASDYVPLRTGTSFAAQR